MNENKKYVDALIKKSSEAIIMSLEIANKPSINYRSEGFIFFYVMLGS